MPYKCKKKRRERQKEYSGSHYQRNKEKVRARSAENRKRYRAAWVQYKSEQKCSHCGFSHPAVIDFHHTDPKPDDEKINKLTSGGQFEKARKEAEEKCIPLCANCHRILHWNEVHDTT